MKNALLWLKGKTSWLLESMARTYAAIAVLAVAVVVGTAVTHAATSWDVTNNPPMYLYASMTSATQTSNIKIAALSRNGSTVTFPTTTGGMLHVTQKVGALQKVEDIYYASATVDQTTKIVTLSGVIRDACWNVFRQITGCGNGYRFTRGATVELNVDARLLNWKANTDRANTFKAVQTFGSGAKIAGLLYPLKLSELTTAQRDALTPEEGMLIKNSTTGTIQMYAGGTWASVGTSSTSNATETSIGTVELATTTDILSHAITGTVGPTALWVNVVTRSSTGSTQASKIPALSADGVLSGSLLATNFSSVTKANSGTLFLRGDGKFVKPAASGTTLAVNKTLLTTTGNLNQTTFATLSTDLESSVLFSVGDVVMMTFQGVFNRTGGTPGKIVCDARIGNNPISPYGSGAVATLLDPGSSVPMQHYQFTVYHQVATGGTLSVLPVCRAYTGGGSTFVVIKGATFQVVKVH